MTIRVERPDDYAAIAEVVAAAFGSQAEAQLVEAIRASPGFVPELSLVAEMNERIVKRTVFRKPGEPEDISNTIAFLVSEEARYITGQVVHVAGGIDLFTF